MFILCIHSECYAGAVVVAMCSEVIYHLFAKSMYTAYSVVWYKSHGRANERESKSFLTFNILFNLLLCCLTSSKNDGMKEISRDSGSVHKLCPEHCLKIDKSILNTSVRPYHFISIHFTFTFYQRVWEGNVYLLMHAQCSHESVSLSLSLSMFVNLTFFIRFRESAASPHRQTPKIEDKQEHKVMKCQNIKSVEMTLPNSLNIRAINQQSVYEIWNFRSHVTKGKWSNWLQSKYVFVDFNCEMTLIGDLTNLLSFKQIAECSLWFCDTIEANHFISLRWKTVSVLILSISLFFTFIWLILAEQEVNNGCDFE